MIQGRIKKNGHSVDFQIMAITIIISVIGILFSFSASYYVAINSGLNPYSNLVSHIITFSLGIFVMIFMTHFNYQRLKKFAFLFAVAVGMLLLITLLSADSTGLGVQRALIVFGIAVMPGELAKIACVILIAVILSDDKQSINTKEGLIPCVVILVVYGGLIFLQPNLSTAIIVVCIIVGMIFIAGLQWKTIMIFGAVGAVAGGILIFFFLEPYQVSRLTSFGDPFQDPLGDGMQVVRSLYALGSGGLWGTGVGQGIFSYLYLPDADNDFIFAVIGEEFGLIGTLSIMLLYAYLIYRIFMVAVNAKDRLGLLLCSGIGIMLAVQVVFHIATVTGSMPATGIILPFISSGDNAMVVFFFAIGIVQNVSKFAEREAV